MIEQVLSKIVFDRTCPFCMGVKHVTFKDTSTVPQPCKMCNDESYLYKDRPTALVVPHANCLPTPIVKTLETQNVKVFHSGIDIERLRGIRFDAIYFFDIEIGSGIYNAVIDKRNNDCEVHVYYDRNKK